MRTPTDEQRAVLELAARVRVVRAAPGSGKTWLVAELIRQELITWPTKTSGIAALSFTRVGGDEIRKAVGHELGHPHFVGTIDAFLFRYVLRPFLRRCFPWFPAPRLIPGDWGAEHWSACGRQQAAIGKGVNLFSCVFIDEVDGKAVVARKPHPARPLRRLDGEELAEVKNAKKQLWQRSGCLTHSDAALWASKILEHEALGASVRAELLRRFPLMVVDELQDTGYFLGKSILLLLQEAAGRGVLVGDPDQAIYEFSGARPDLFARFEGMADAVARPLASSKRCPPAVTNAAAHLKESGGTIGPAQKTGRAILVRYVDMIADVRRMVGVLAKGWIGFSVKVIARQTSTVTALVGRSAMVAPKLGCPPLNHLQRAVVAFRQGRQAGALAAARAAIEVVLFEHEGVDDAELEASGVEPSRWRRLAVDCVLRASAEASTGTLYDWQERVGQILDTAITSSGLSVARGYVSGMLRPKHRKASAASCVGYLPQVDVSDSLMRNVPVQTVHGVKGETHDVTLFVCPDVNRADRCPSVVWWSTADKDLEERRIAYVAMTRTQGDLIVSVSDACYQRLAKLRPEFVGSFECMTADQCSAALSEGYPSRHTTGVPTETLG